MSKRLLISIIILSMFIVTLTWVPTLPITNKNISDIRKDTDSSPVTKDQSEGNPDAKSNPEKRNVFNIAGATPADGILNPVTVEQSGYAASENISARTDSYQNLGYDLPLDVAHSWIADEAEVSVWNLEKLYAVNGSLDVGVPGTNLNPNGTVEFYPLGWVANSTDDDAYADELQLAAYDTSTRNFVSVENQGYKSGQDVWGHSPGSKIVWSQVVDNAPYTENFIFSMDYFYLRGPIDGPTGYAISGNCSLALFIDGSVIWNQSLLLLTQRGIWYNTEQIPITISGAPSTFLLEIGIIVDERLVLEKKRDYDGNGVQDGIENAAYITVFFDDVSFIKQTPPTAEQVKLEFITGGVIEGLAGSLGTYYASIPNASYWTSTPVSVALSANTSVSFDYKTRLYVHRFTDSNWRNDISSPGVAYIVDHGISSDLTFYSYVGYLGGYEDPQMTIEFPSDWENLTVSDPFLTDLTGSCDIGTGYVTVPTSIIDRLGWWEVKLESPNYAKSIKSQILDGIFWSDGGEFRISNTTRADITLGTNTQILGSLIDVNVTWYKPSDIVWVTELISGGSLGQIYSSSQVFASGSSPAGEWWVEVYWENGTEVAYDRAQFAVIHTANLVAEPTEITTDTGLTIKGLIRYTDGDTSDPILDLSAMLVANWSGSSIPLVANPTQNWWEADFDTSLIGEGNFVIVVNASRPFYDDVSCQIVVYSIRVTRLTSPNAPWTASDWGDIVSLTFKFEGYDYGAEAWGPVVNESDITVSANWTTGYWSISEDITPGIFVMSLDTRSNDAGTWLLNVTLSKPNHQSKIILITLIVSPATSSLSVIEGFSARVDLDESFSLTLRYLDYENSPISSASVVVDNVSPSSGLDRTPVTEVGGEPGNYSISITPRSPGVFTIRFIASKTNSENATAVFVLVVKDVATKLIIPGTGSVEIGLTDVYNTTFRFEMSNGTGISGATINVTYTGNLTIDPLTYDLFDKGLGDYSIEFASSSSGTYLITIAAFKESHQSASDAFFLIVREISTNMTSLNETADLVGFGKDYRLFVSYTNSTGYGLVGADVSIENVVPEIGLSWDNTTVESPGVYSILLTPLDSNTFTILVQAKLQNHVTQFILFTLTATAIATSLASLNISTIISLDQTFTVTLLYQDEDLNPLDSANITVSNPPEGLDFSPSEDLGTGYYQVTITPLKVGTFDIIFKANRSGYQNGYTTFTIGTQRIPTTLQVSEGSTDASITYSHEHQFLVLFKRTDTNLNVTGATIDVHTFPETGISSNYLPQGEGYLITLMPERVGSWTVTIRANLTGYSPSLLEYTLDVTSIPVQVELLSENSAIEGQPFLLTVRLTQEATSIPVTEARVSFRLSLTGTGAFIRMEEDSGTGEYSAEYTFQLFLDDSEYLLEIIVEKDYHVLPGDIYTQSFFKTISIPARMAPVIAGGSSAGIGLIALLVVVRIYQRKRKSQMTIDLANKRRFDDADNIIGIIVMHKKSGIPIYSKIVKGGFEEGIVAAFISAVTHFREEFEMFDEEAIRVIPISDIIRAVQTRNLICAFVTVRSASIDHNRKMEAYAMQVGTYLDDLYDEMKPPSMIDERVTEMLDYIYDTTMDGDLIKFYKISTTEKFPRRYRYLEELMLADDTKHCSKPTLLARGQVSFGITEARGCTLVLEAIEKKLITACKDDETLVSEIDFAEYLMEQESKDKPS